MPVQLYNPFERFEFSGRKCFLSGVPTNGEDEYMTVFPQWMMEQFDLFDKSFKYLQAAHSLRIRHHAEPHDPFPEEDLGNL
jgi:hypothetical protein